MIITDIFTHAGTDTHSMQPLGCMVRVLIPRITYVSIQPSKCLLSFRKYEVFLWISLDSISFDLNFVVGLCIFGFWGWEGRVSEMVALLQLEKLSQI